MTAPVFEAAGVTKTFGSVTALDRVDLACLGGEVHAVLGENGAGKSTLMHVASGLIDPDGGELRLCGERVVWRSADEAHAAGIAMVHQHFMLVPTMTVSENLALAEGALGVLDRAVLDQRVQELARTRGLDIGDPARTVEQLSVGEQQRVEILKALVDVPALLILDEPTAVLTPSEVVDLFAMLRELAAKGTAIAIVTHKLAEVFAIADRVTVLRHGSRVVTGMASEFDRDSLARSMVGEGTPAATAPDRAEAWGDVLLEVRSLVRMSGARRALDRVDLSVQGGEVVVVAGVEGNGQQELQEAIAGLQAFEQAGEVRMCGEPISSPAEARRLGLAVVPADRRRDGLVGEMALWENLLLSINALESAAPRGWIDPTERIAWADRKLESFAVRPSDPTLPAAALSGGNQQRVILARELDREDVRVVVVASPTRGLDLVATAEVHRRLRELARRGAAVLVLSTDLDEVEALADRVMVLFRGRLRAVADGPMDRASIGRLMAGLEEHPS